LVGRAVVSSGIGLGGIDPGIVVSSSFFSLAVVGIPVDVELTVSTLGVIAGTSSFFVGVGALVNNTVFVGLIGVAL